MTLYRDHKGGLSKSIDTVVEVNSLLEIKEYISKSWFMDVCSIDIKPYGFDSRIGWDTHIVICKFVDGMECPVGFTNKYIK